MPLGAIADDITGGTDLASQIRLLRRTVVQILDPDFCVPADVDVAIISLKSRTVPVAQAVELSLAAAKRLGDAGSEQIFFKYCSTFDSTNDGNIGPVSEALLGVLGAPFTIACPAYPLLGRTVYAGHLFVGQQLLSESSMRDHPLTPMTDSDLIRVLQRQTSVPVGHVPLAAVDEGTVAVRARFQRLQEEGCRIAVADAVSDRHIAILADASRDLKLVTGGAALGASLAQNRPSANRSATTAVPPGGPVAVLSGSCSEMTQQQVKRLSTHVPSLEVDPLSLAQDPEALVRLQRWATTHISPLGVLVYTTNRTELVREAQRQLGPGEAARLLEVALGSVAEALLAHGVRVFVVAGGETSGAVLHALGVRALAFEPGSPDIEPGVPWAQSIEPPGLLFALKSGNFGGPDFFNAAMRRVA